MAERRITGPVNDPGRVPTQATQAAIEAETNEDTYVPPDLLKHNPGAAKGWAKFDLAGTVNASQNVASVTDVGTGNWDVLWATDFSGVDYSVMAVVRDDDEGGGYDILSLFIGGMTAAQSSVRLLDVNDSAVDPAAADDMHIIAFGDQ